MHSVEVRLPTGSLTNVYISGEHVAAGCVVRSIMVRNLRRVLDSNPYVFASQVPPSCACRNAVCTCRPTFRVQRMDTSHAARGCCCQRTLFSQARRFDLCFASAVAKVVMGTLCGLWEEKEETQTTSAIAVTWLVADSEMCKLQKGHQPGWQTKGNEMKRSSRSEKHGR